MHSSHARRSGRQPRATASLWLLVLIWGLAGGISGCAKPPVLIDADPCPPGWVAVANDMDDAEQKGLYPDWRLYSALLLEHCDQIEALAGD